MSRSMSRVSNKESGAFGPARQPGQNSISTTPRTIPIHFGPRQKGARLTMLRIRYGDGSRGGQSGRSVRGHGVDDSLGDESRQFSRWPRYDHRNQPQRLQRGACPCSTDEQDLANNLVTLGAERGDPGGCRSTPCPARRQAGQLRRHKPEQPRIRPTQLATWIGSYLGPAMSNAGREGHGT